MIVFDLACQPIGHVFEAWFGSTDDYEGQRARGLVSCPLCGSHDVAKAAMAPNVSAKGNSRTLPAIRKEGGKAPAPTPEAMKALMGAMAEAQRRVLEHSDYVGNRFADEARAIHDGDIAHRPIHGIATPAQARSLVEDGIGVAPLPFPVRPPNTDN